MQQDSTKLSLKLGTYMRERHCTQAYIAEQAQVDQATVSRFLKKPPQRVTMANQKLCSYAESIVSGATVQQDQSAAQRALEVCWNKSEVHAQAVSKILDALAELCQRDSDEEVASG
jgi:predicted transcriptional regulator